MDIGQRIKEVMLEKGHNACWLAAQVPCERSNIYNMFHRKSVNIELLFILSDLLQHDFFAELSDEWRRRKANKTDDASGKSPE